MCKFCRSNVERDNMAKSFFNESLELGFVGDIFITGMIDFHKKDIVVGLVNTDGDAKEYKKHIEYCPFCGEEL